MNLTLIAAMSKNRIIGNNNELIWHLPADLKRFKSLTNGHHIIMGRKTYESLGRPLPNRTNIIITRQKDFHAPGCLIVHSLEEAIQKSIGDEQPFIVGGAEIYKQALPYANKIELTIVDSEYDGDSSFPEIDAKKWEIVSKENYPSDEKNKHNMSFIQYRKIN
tara:strand:- start:483 stop:971 length:489 start_codon:yes stop_codon:yes gene_type:complete